MLIAAYLVVLVGAFAALRAWMPGVASTLFGSPLRGQLSGLALITLPVVTFYAVSEASRRRGTWGKQRLGLQVVAESGEGIGLGCSFVRAAVKFAPWELAHTCIWQITFAGDDVSPVVLVGLSLVYALIGANLLSALRSPRNQALYDRLARTVVVVPA